MVRINNSVSWMLEGKPVTVLSVGKTLGSKCTFWAMLNYFFLNSLYWGEKIRVMVLGQSREPVHTWGQDSHANSSEKALPHNVAGQDHLLVLAAGQGPATIAHSVISAAILPVWRHALMCLRCLSAFTMLLSTLPALSASSFTLQRPKWISIIYDLPLSPPPLSGAPLALPGCLVLRLQHCCKILPVFYKAELLSWFPVKMEHWSLKERLDCMLVLALGWLVGSGREGTFENEMDY